ncbi:MAG TPA: hypothetical protein P5137_05955 [Candidatus Brocadiia bacterium]|nr:hypothetical protein [Candidatus Brocadiia bacterium]
MSSKAWLWALVCVAAVAVAMPAWATFPATVDPTQSSKSKTTTKDTDKEKKEKEKKEKEKKEKEEKEKKEREKKAREQPAAKSKASPANASSAKAPKADSEKESASSSSKKSASSSGKGKISGGLSSEAKDDVTIARGDKVGSSWKVWSAENWSSRKALRKMSDSIKAGSLSEEAVKALSDRAAAMANLGVSISAVSGATEEQRKQIRAALDGVAANVFGTTGDARPKLLAALDAKLTKGDLTSVEAQELCEQVARLYTLKASLGSAAGLSDAAREKAGEEFDSLLANLFE